MISLYWTIIFNPMEKRVESLCHTAKPIHLMSEATSWSQHETRQDPFSWGCFTVIHQSSNVSMSGKSQGKYTLTEAVVCFCIHKSLAVSPSWIWTQQKLVASVVEVLFKTWVLISALADPIIVVCRAPQNTIKVLCYNSWNICNLFNFDWQAVSLPSPSNTHFFSVGCYMNG